MSATTTVPALIWDEPEGCSPRGWLLIHRDRHPDAGHYLAHGLPFTNTFQGGPPEWVCCGWYLDYSDTYMPPDPERRGCVLAKCYCFRVGPGGGCHELGFDWFKTADEAKTWAEGLVRGYVDVPVDSAISTVRR